MDLRENGPPPEQKPQEHYFSFNHKPLKEYPAHVDLPVVGGDKLNDVVAQLCRAQVQTEAIISERNSVGMLFVQWEVEGQALDFNPDGKIIVPERCVAEIEMIPCISKSDHKNRFGIYNEKLKKELELVRFKDRDLYAVHPSSYRIWIETAPSLPAKLDEIADSNSPPLPPYLPDAEQVWTALRLAEVGTYGRESRRVQRLEVAVLPCPKSPKSGAKTASPADDLALIRKWCFVSEVRAEIQPWVWRGLPEGGYEKIAELIKPQDTAQSEDRDENPSILRKVVEGEAPSFGEREDAAARVQTGIVNYAAPFKLWGKGVSTPAPPFIIYQDQGEQDEVPGYYRVKLLVKSRYAGLGDSTQEEGPFSHATTVSGEIEWPWNGDKNFLKPPQRKEAQKRGWLRQSSHRRILFRGNLRRKLDLPRVKMVIPLLEAMPEPTAKRQCGEPPHRPGFIVLTREPLRSPWHRLIAEVDWARVNLGGPGDQEVIKELPEFGPDPITAEGSFDWAFKAKSELKALSELDGRAFGLTYEREADAAFFPNAGFYFDPPFQPGTKNPDLDPTMNDFSNDWFVKVRFRWEIRPSYVMDNLASTLVSESTQPWQVRLLAPFQWIHFANNPHADLARVTFDFQGGFPVFSGPLPQRTNQKDGKIGKLGNPFPPAYGQNVDNPNASPASLLLFVAWSLVPDFLNAERSKVVHSIFAVPAGERPFPLFRNSSISSVLKPEGGNFLLLFGRKGDLDQLKPSEWEKTKLQGLDWLVENYLFPAPQPASAAADTEKIDQDAKAMITRCSPPIFAS